MKKYLFLPALVLAVAFMVGSSSISVKAAGISAAQLSSLQQQIQMLLQQLQAIQKQSSSNGVIPGVENQTLKIPENPGLNGNPVAIQVPPNSTPTLGGGPSNIEYPILSTSSAISWCHNFNANLGIGSTGSDISALETALNKEGLGNLTESTYDDTLASAVSGFQEKYRSDILTPNGLQYGTGYVGPSTRAKLNNLYGCQIAHTLLPTPMPPIISTTTQSSPSITVLSPTADTSFTLGSPIPINWSENYDAGKSITVYLYKPMVGNVFISQPLIGMYGNDSWTVPANAAPSAGQYLIEVCDNNQSSVVAGNPLCGRSQYFNITASSVATTTQSSPSITVVSPNGGNILTEGMDNAILWSGVSVGTPVKIGLVKSSAVDNTDISGSIVGWINLSATTGGAVSGITWDFKTLYDANGSFSGYVTPGSYKIIVQTQDANGNWTIWNYSNNKPGNWDVSDNPFTIQASASSATNTTVSNAIIVTSPTAGSSWQIGRTYKISWQATEDIWGVQLLKGGVAVQKLDYSPDQPYINWTIPAFTSFGNIMSGNDYQIRILGKSDYGDSGVFSITSASPIATTMQPSVVVTNPSGGVYAPGQTINIQWQSSGNASGKVNIESWYTATSTGHTGGIIALDVPDTGAYSWIIPANQVSASNYQISVLQYNTNITGWSGQFEITNSSSSVGLSSDSNSAMTANVFDQLSNVISQLSQILK